MFKPTLLVDFDDTITVGRGLDTPPNPDAVVALNKLKDTFNIVIYSCRANCDIFVPHEVVELREYLDSHNIPYDDISTRKPTFFALIDDRSLNPRLISWDEIVNKLLTCAEATKCVSD